MRRISVFGSTGSIGQNTLDLINRNKDLYDVVALTGGANVEQLAEDARRFGAKIAVTAYEHLLPTLRELLDGSGVEVAAGPSALLEAANRPVDWAMSAIVGAAGLAPSLELLRQGSTLALANKETLVCAGPLVREIAARNGATLLPVDSEHSAVFQALVGEDISTVERIIITASGGAFRDRPISDLAHVSVEEASKHPNWHMGQRITIDSASMFNKALEVIETKEYFQVSPDQIEVLVHPESLVHALVGYSDGAMMAHVGAADMRHAIGYALHYPNRMHLPVERLDLAQIGALSFSAPDIARYPALRIAREVMAADGYAGAAFNASKEAALDAFIGSQIGFLEMASVVEETLAQISPELGLQNAAMSLDTVLEVDGRARRIAQEIINRADR